MPGIKILIVEDDVSWHSIIQDALRDFSFKCEFSVAPDFDKACTLLDQESFDLVTMDMALSKLEEQSRIPSRGQFLIRRLNKNSPDTGIIVLSGSRGFQERPDQVATLVTECNIVAFLWKADPEVASKLREEVNSFFQFKGLNMVDNYQRLLKLKSEAEALEDTILELKNQYEIGSMPDAQYMKLYRSFQTSRNELIDQIDMLLTGPDGKILSAALHRSKRNSSVIEVAKTELTETANKQGWGQKVIEQINEHRGEIVSLVITIALELSKQVTRGQ